MIPKLEVVGSSPIARSRLVQQFLKTEFQKVRESLETLCKPYADSFLVTVSLHVKIKMSPPYCFARINLVASQDLLAHRLTPHDFTD